MGFGEDIYKLIYLQVVPQHEVSNVMHPNLNVFELLMIHQIANELKYTLTIVE